MIVITPPSKPAVPLDEVKQHLRIEQEVTEFDDVIASCVDAATSHLETRTGYMLIERTLEQKFSSFDCVILSATPVTSIVEVRHFDAQGAEKTLSGADYRLAQTVIGAQVQSTGTFPTAQTRWDAVSVRFKAGFVSAYGYPPALRAALLLHVGSMFAYREGDAEKPALPTGAYAALIAPYQQYYV